MLKQPSYKSIFALAIPAIFGGIVEPVLSLTDVAVVGNIPSENLQEEANISALAAVGLAGSLISALMWIFAQVKSAISAIVSKAYGSNSITEVSTLIPQMIAFNLLVGILAFVGTFFISDWIFSELLSAPASTSNYAVAYYDIRAFGFPITLVTFSLFGVFRGLQNTYWAMIISIIGGSLNIVLDFILALGWGNFCEPMGIEGAAYASLVAQIVMFVLAIYFLLKTKLNLHFTFKLNNHFKPMINMALNLMVRTVTLNLALILTHKYANIYGKIPAATHAVLLNLWLFSAFFLDGFATAINAMSGKYLGARDFDSLKRALRRNLMMALMVSVVLIVVILTFHQPIMYLLTKDESVRSFYLPIIILFAVCLPFNALAFTLDGVYKGMGEAKFLRNLLLITTFGGFLPVLLIGDAIQPKLQVIWIALIVWIGLRGILPLLYFKPFIAKLQHEKKN